MVTKSANVWDRLEKAAVEVRDLVEIYEGENDDASEQLETAYLALRAAAATLAKAAKQKRATR